MLSLSAARATNALMYGSAVWLFGSSWKSADFGSMPAVSAKLLLTMAPSAEPSAGAVCAASTGMTVTLDADASMSAGVARVVPPFFSFSRPGLLKHQQGARLVGRVVRDGDLRALRDVGHEVYLLGVERQRNDESRGDRHEVLLGRHVVVREELQVLEQVQVDLLVRERGFAWV